MNNIERKNVDKKTYINMVQFLLNNQFRNCDIIKTTTITKKRIQQQFYVYLENKKYQLFTLEKNASPNQTLFLSRESSEKVALA